MSAGRRTVSVTPEGDVGGVHPGDPAADDGDVTGSTGPAAPTPRMRPSHFVSRAGREIMLEREGELTILC